jgi:hypothetical protein
MVELGCKKKIPGSTCEKKWKELNPVNTQHQQEPQQNCGGENGSSDNSSSSSTSSTATSVVDFSMDMKRNFSQLSELEEDCGDGGSIDGDDDDAQGLGIPVKFERG